MSLKPGPEVPLLPLSFQVSGGIAGRVEVLDVAADGLAAWTDMRRQTTRSVQLSPPDLAQLRALLAEVSGAEIVDDGPGLPGRCRDCFEYRLILAANVKPRMTVVTSDRLAVSTYRELIVTLLTIVADVKRESP